MHLLWMTLLPFLFRARGLRARRDEAPLARTMGHGIVHRRDLYYPFPWQCNRRHRNPVVHALGVQMPLLVVAWYY